MKKVIILFLGCLLVTGCKSSKKFLNCTLTQQVSENTIKQDVSATFSGDNVLNLTMNVETILEEQYIEHIDTFVEQIDKQFESYKGKKGITTNTTKKENSVIFNMDINVDEMDEEAKNILGIMDTESSYETAKKSLENAGYTCK